MQNNKARVNHAFVAIKQAVDQKDLTIQEANEIILK